jgi:hypothetical protein
MRVCYVGQNCVYVGGGGCIPYTGTKDSRYSRRWHSVRLPTRKTKDLVSIPYRGKRMLCSQRRDWHYGPEKYFLWVERWELEATTELNLV